MRLISLVICEIEVVTMLVIYHRPASCHGGYTLLSPSLHSHCVLSYSGISLPEAKLTHDEACDQLKGPQSVGLHTHPILNQPR
jgi:hypothetical protein